MLPWCIFIKVQTVIFHSFSRSDSGNASVGRKPRVESGYFSLEKPKPEEDEDRQHHRQQEQEPSPPQQQHLLSSSSTTSSSSSRSRYLSFDPELFSSPISSHKHTSHDPHSVASTQTYGIAHNACAHKHNTQRLNKSEEHVPALESPPSSDATLCPLPSPDRLSSPNSHANVLPSSLSSSQSSLNSEQGPESRVGGASGRVGRGGQGYATLADVPRARRLSHRDAYRSSQKRQELRARTRSPGREEVERLFGRERRWWPTVTFTHKGSVSNPIFLDSIFISNRFETLYMGGSSCKWHAYGWDTPSRLQRTNGNKSAAEEFCVQMHAIG